MSVVAGRLVAALVLAGSAVVWAPAPAHACSCAEASLQDQARAASDVFSGTVTDQRAGASPRRGTSTYDVDVERVYKGAVATGQVTVASPSGRTRCGLGRLPTDRPYVFFAGVGGSALEASVCGGTAPASGALVSKVERILGDGRAPVPASAPAEPEGAEFTEVADSRPASVTRLAAPGAALVLVGLLGLVVVRRLARRA